MEETIGGGVMLHPEWKQLFEAAKEWDYGSVHLHAEIAAIMKLPYGSQKYYSMVNRCWKEMRTVQKHVHSYRRTGYRVAMPNEHVEAATGLFRKGFRRIKVGHDVATCTRTDLLTAEERKRSDDFTARYQRIIGTIGTCGTRLRLIASGRTGLAEAGDEERIGVVPRKKDEPEGSA